MIEIRRYITPPGKDVFGEWLAGLKDLRARAKIAVPNRPSCDRELRRLQAIEPEPVRTANRLRSRLSAVLRGAGQHMHFAFLRRRQAHTAVDIERAHNYLKDYQERTGTE